MPPPSYTLPSVRPRHHLRQRCHIRPIPLSLHWTSLPSPNLLFHQRPYWTRLRITDDDDDARGVATVTFGSSNVLTRTVSSRRTNIISKRLRFRISFTGAVTATKSSTVTKASPSPRSTITRRMKLPTLISPISRKSLTPSRMTSRMKNLTPSSTIPTLISWMHYICWLPYPMKMMVKHAKGSKATPGQSNQFIDAQRGLPG